MASPPPSPAQFLACPNCGSENKTNAKFCGRCGAKLRLPGSTPVTPVPVTPVPVTPVPVTPVVSPPSPSASIPLFTVPVRLTEDGIRSQGEAAKVALFRLTGKRTLVGKKPEQYIVLESMVWTNRVYVRVHGVYSSTYVVDAVFPLSVGEETVEVEIPGLDKRAPEKGTLKLAAKLRKTNRTESTAYYDERIEEVQVQLPPRTGLQPLRTVRPPLTVEDLQKVLATTLDWAKKDLQARIGKPQVSDAIIEKEDLDLSDHEIILVPYCVLTYVNSKTGEKHTLTFDSLTGSLAPSPVATK